MAPARGGAGGGALTRGGAARAGLPRGGCPSLPSPLPRVRSTSPPLPLPPSRPAGMGAGGSKGAAAAAAAAAVAGGAEGRRAASLGGALRALEAGAGGRGVQARAGTVRQALAGATLRLGRLRRSGAGPGGAAHVARQAEELRGALARVDLKAQVHGKSLKAKKYLREIEWAAAALLEALDALPEPGAPPPRPARGACRRVRAAL